MLGSDSQMDENQITKAIRRAEPGIARYLEIMRLFPQTNVAENQDFQRKYNGFYRVRQRPTEWYQTYYSYMERLKGSDVRFSMVLEYFRIHLRRYEPSFSSKFVATHNPNMPIWDRHILSNIGLRAPGYNSPRKFDDAKTAYQAIQKWYEKFECSADGKLIIIKFDEVIGKSLPITSIKKIDFVLWQIRAQHL
jgi:hypothetical protein